MFDSGHTLKPLLLVTCNLRCKIWLTFSVASGLFGFLSGWCFSAIWNKHTTILNISFNVYTSPAKDSLTTLLSTVYWSVYIDQIQKWLLQTNLQNFEYLTRLCSKKIEDEFVNHLPAACDLQILLVFYQHPAWFISL